MFDKPETYEELIRKKRCVELTKHYNITKEDLETIYNFLRDNPNGDIRCSGNSIVLIFKDNTSKSIVISANCIDASIDGIYLNNKSFSIYHHIYVSNSSGSSWSSSGGSSSNNNNNNNNNNNR